MIVSHSLRERSCFLVELKERLGLVFGRGFWEESSYFIVWDYQRLDKKDECIGSGHIKALETLLKLISSWKSFHVSYVRH